MTSPLTVGVLHIGVSSIFERQKSRQRQGNAGAMDCAKHTGHLPTVYTIRGFQRRRRSAMMRC